MKSNGLIITLGSIGFIAGILGLILSFLPLGYIPVIPAIIGLLLGGAGWYLTLKAESKSKLVKITTIISAIAVVVAVGTEMTSSNEVAEDKQFEKKIEASKEEAKKDLEEALEEIEGELEELEELDDSTELDNL